MEYSHELRKKFTKYKNKQEFDVNLLFIHSIKLKDSFNKTKNVRNNIILEQTFISEILLVQICNIHENTEDTS